MGAESRPWRQSPQPHEFMTNLAQRYPSSTGIVSPRGRGVTLVETIVALAITMIFIGGATAAFLRILRASDEAEASVRAYSAARSAVDLISRDLARLQLDTDPDFQQFLLIDRRLPFGDNIDHDGDGIADEEFFTGFDEDGDWEPEHDNHAEINGLFERPHYVDLPDHGDFQVDEDVRFSADEVVFIIPPGTLGPEAPRQRVTYRLGAFEGEGNVLLRITADDPPPIGPSIETVEPVLFEVVSFDVLAWNANDDVESVNPGKPYWTAAWNAEEKTFPEVRPANAPFGVPPFKLPASFLVRVTVNAERQPLEEITGWPGPRQLRTVFLSTVVNVESVIQDSRYDLFVRDEVLP